MNDKTDYPRRFHVLPVATVLLLFSGLAAVNAVQTGDMIATDGKVVVVDGRHTQTLTRQLAFEPGMTLRIENGNGKIVVTGWDKDELLVTAEKQMELRVGGLGWLMGKLKIPYKTTDAIDEYFETVGLDLQATEKGISVVTVVPKWKPNVNVRVHYDIKVPRQANLDIETTNGTIFVSEIDGHVVTESSNGKVTCENVDGEVDATTHNGSVICRNVSGSVSANTSNGSVLVEYASPLSKGDSIVCGTSNGSIRLKLPAKSSFDLVAKTHNGRIRSSFEIDETGEKNGKRRLAGRAGQGGASIELETTNGSITVEELDT